MTISLYSWCHCCLFTKSRLTILRPYGLYPARLLSPWDFPGKNTGVGCHFLLLGIFPTQGSNPCLLHYQAGSLPLSHQGSPLFLIVLLFLSIICWQVYQFYWFFSKNQLLVSFYLVFKFLFYWFLDIILFTFFSCPLPLFFLAILYSLQNLSSPNQELNLAPCLGSWVLTTRSPVNSLLWL